MAVNDQNGLALQALQSPYFKQRYKNTWEATNGQQSGGVITDGTEATDLDVTQFQTVDQPVTGTPTVGLANADGNSTALLSNAALNAKANQDAAGWFGVSPGSSTSKFGSTMSGVGAGVQGLAALGSLYYQGKNYGLQKEAAQLERDKYKRAVAADDRATANKKAFASAVGGTYA